MSSMEASVAGQEVVRSTRFGKAVPLSFGAVLVSFLFSFVNISCQGQRLMSLSGFQLATGTQVEQAGMFGDKQTQKIPSEPLAMLALLAAGAGLLLSLGGRQTKTLTTLIGAGGAGLLLLLKMKVDGDVLKQGQGMLQLDYGGGFIAAVIFFIVAAVLASGAVERMREPTA